MSDQDMRNAITAAIMTDANLIILIRALLINNVNGVMITQQLQNICAVLEISS